MLNVDPEALGDPLKLRVFLDQRPQLVQPRDDALLDASKLLQYRHGLRPFRKNARRCRPGGLISQIRPESDIGRNLARLTSAVRGAVREEATSWSVSLRRL